MRLVLHESGSRDTQEYLSLNAASRQTGAQTGRRAGPQGGRGRRRGRGRGTKLLKANDILFQHVCSPSPRVSSLPSSSRSPSGPSRRLCSSNISTDKYCHTHRANISFYYTHTHTLTSEVQSITHPQQFSTAWKETLWDCVCVCLLPPLNKQGNL